MTTVTRSIEVSQVPIPPSSIALFAYAGTGHVNPMTAVGKALQKRGHRVVFVHMPDMGPRIRAAGLEFLPFGEAEQPLGTLAQQDKQMGELTGMDSVHLHVERGLASSQLMLRDVPQILRRNGPFDVLMVDSVEFAPLVVGELLDIPCVTVDLLPPIMVESSAPPFIFGWKYSEWQWSRVRNWLGTKLFLSSLGSIRALLAEQRREWGLPPKTDLWDLWSRRLRIAQLPQQIDFPRRWWPANFHHTGPFIDNAARPQYPFSWEKLDGRPLVYASLGTFNNANVKAFRIIAEACHSLPVQLVLSTGGGLQVDALTDLPGNPIVVQMAPQVELISKAVLVITHGGMNTSLEALSQGKPMVVIPIGADQPGVARRLERVGVAEVVPIASLSVPLLTAAVRKVLSAPEYSKKAEAMQHHLQELRGVDRAVELVEGLLKQTREEKATKA